MRGTDNRNAYDFLRQGAKHMTYPCWQAGDLQAAYRCFANAAIEDHKTSSVKGNPEAGFDAQAFATAHGSARSKGGRGYWRAYSWLAYCLIAAYVENQRKPVGDVPFGDLKAAKDFADTADASCKERDAVSDEPTDYVVPWVIGHYHVATGTDKTLGLNYYQKAVALNGDNNMNLQAEYGEALIALGRHDEALRAIARAGRGRPWYAVDMAWAYYHKGRDDPYFYRLALEELARMDVLPGDREFPVDGLLIEALASAQLGDALRAERAVRRFRTAKPNWGLPEERDTIPFLEPADRDHWLEGCSKAGL
jgi:tetratricopeptide (TPR) repeat protein